jgi:hypothetical protein
MIHSEDNAAFLKQEITRLKVKLSELDSDSEPTSAVCGHDVALENLKKTVKENSHQGLSQLLSYDLENGWYTTNLPTYSQLEIISRIFQPSPISSLSFLEKSSLEIIATVLFQTRTRYRE